ncbi:MAG: phosphoribosylanthranilate isomerase [Methanobacteriota archaeon]|nr:MAG: phosphoribosylanthranilate isomerase [Euryarchaeota archaeon]
MKVKICGITSVYDATLCEEMGADAVGFVHYPGRRRSLALDEIARIASSLGPMTTKVIVCAPGDAQEAIDLSERGGVDVIQTYSLDPEALDNVRGSGLKVIRAVSIERADAEAFAPHADALVFEQGIPGTGASYDYSGVPVDCCDRAIIAGGLTVDNVGEAKALKPYAVDVSSGVESANGRKDPELVTEFIRRAKR